jgi:hypothetical protein
MYISLPAGLIHKFPNNVDRAGDFFPQEAALYFLDQECTGKILYLMVPFRSMTIKP